MKKIGVILLLLLTSCATRINYPPAPQEQVNIVQNFEIESGKGRVHFFVGKYNGTGVQLNEAVDVFVNEEKVVTLGNKSEFAVIDLSPGDYSFKCQGISTGSDMATPVPTEIEIKSGDLIFLAANFYDKTSNIAYLFGAVGAIAGKNYIYSFVKDNNYKQLINQYKLIPLNK